MIQRPSPLPRNDPPNKANGSAVLVEVYATETLSFDRSMRKGDREITENSLQRTPESFFDTRIWKPRLSLQSFERRGS
jgi:hypothetical protein